MVWELRGQIETFTLILKENPASISDFKNVKI